MGWGVDVIVGGVDVAGCGGRVWLGSDSGGIVVSTSFIGSAEG